LTAGAVDPILDLIALFLREKTMASLHQINIGYSSVEDRLLLRMSARSETGTAEFRFWLTRRFTRLFWQALERARETSVAMDPRVSPDSREALKQFHQEAALEKADFTTPYQEETAATPLGSNPILVSKLNITPKAHGQHTLALLPSKGQGINLTVDLNIIHLFRKLLAEAVRKAEWDLVLDLFPSIVVQDAPRTIN
jgi:hypothetical protein